MVYVTQKKCPNEESNNNNDDPKNSVSRGSNNNYNYGNVCDEVASGIDGGPWPSLSDFR